MDAQHTTPLPTIFSGTIHESDLTGKTQSSNYIVSYHLVLTDTKMENGKFTIHKGELGIGTKVSKGQHSIDVNEERQAIRDEITRFENLKEQNPNYIGNDGLTYQDLIDYYKRLEKELYNIESPLLDHLKTQIVDRINTDYKERTEINVSKEDIKIIPFNKLKMAKIKKAV